MNSRTCGLIFLLSCLGCAEPDTNPSAAGWFDEAPTLRGWDWLGFIGDLDGDGLDDLAALDPITNGIGVVYGREDGTVPVAPDLVFRLPVSNDAAGTAAVALGDINGDGFEDIALRSEFDRSVIVLGRARDGVTEFDLPDAQSFLLPGLTPLAAGDLDGDGIDDLVLTSFEGEVARVIRGRPHWDDTDLDVLMSNGIAVRHHDGALFPAGDINGDGFADLASCPNGGAVVLHSGATLPWGTEQVGTLPNADLGGLDAPADQSDFETVPNIGVPPVQLFRLGDINGDGLEDFASGHLRSSERPVSFVVHGSQSPVQRERASLSQGEGGFRIDGEAASLLAVGDVNDDGAIDLLFGAIGNGGTSWLFDDAVPIPPLSSRLHVELPQAETTPAAGLPLLAPAQAGLYGEHLSTGDFNGDGRADIVAQYRVDRARWGGQLLVGRQP